MDSEVLRIGVLVIILSIYAKMFIMKTPQHDSILQGSDYYQEIMRTESDRRFFEVARMPIETFIRFQDLLCTEGGLVPSRHICTGEKIMMFMHSLTGTTIASQAERWQHSKSTCSVSNKAVRKAILKCRKKLYVVPREGDPLHPMLQETKFAPFRDAIGALDGSHIPAHCDPVYHDVMRNRKQYLSQNVMGVCNFDMLFQYGMYGWEGSAHDSRVFNNSLDRGLPYIVGKYFLGDAGYALNKWCLTPYRGTRYHLRQWISGNAQPQNREELFNLRHAQLRNVIERIFGVAKNAFPVLECMPLYPTVATQAEIVECCFLVLNFRRLNMMYEDTNAFMEYNADGDRHYYIVPEDEADRDPGNDNAPVNRNTTGELNAWRDGIAEELWNGYMIELANRGIAHNMQPQGPARPPIP